VHAEETIPPIAARKTCLAARSQRSTEGLIRLDRAVAKIVVTETTTMLSAGIRTVARSLGAIWMAVLKSET